MINFVAIVYQKIAKPIFFKFDAEDVHIFMLNLGEAMGNIAPVRLLTSMLFANKPPILSQKIAGLNFNSPLGLAAGFDYEAKLPRFLPSLGFGFTTIGTITNHSYQGNPKPRLGRLPKSKSLLVNKGFKNPGATTIIKKIATIHTSIPFGISIGQTNNGSLETISDAIADIVSTFKHFESKPLPHTHYELNISCPNLHTHLDFYQPKNSTKLLVEIQKLKLSRPVFIKLPIVLTDSEFSALLRAISPFKCVTGIIVGNLQTNRHHPTIDQQEVARFSRGNFSGLPTQARSLELISLAYKQYDNRFIIIGCGGVFSATDAYNKIAAGASLIQLITGLIYQGPQLVSQINHDLPKILHHHGFSRIADAVGSAN